MRIIYDRACCGYDIFVSEVKVIRFISPCRRKGTLRISKDDSFTVRELEYRASTSSIYSSISEGVFFSYDMMLV